MYMYMYSYRPPHSLLGLRKSMADSADADTPRGAQCRRHHQGCLCGTSCEAGVAANVVAAHLRAAPAPDGVAAVAAEKERCAGRRHRRRWALPRWAANPLPRVVQLRILSHPLAAAAAPPSKSPRRPMILLRIHLPAAARPGRSAKWGARAAERLGAANDFLYDLEFIDSCGIDDEACITLTLACVPTAHDCR